MKYIPTIITALALPIIAASAIPCSNQKKIDAENNNNVITKANSSDTLIFSYAGASVAPQYYRSYIIRVTSRQVYYTISDYSKILSKNSLKLTKTSYDSFKKAINGLQIKKRNEVTGGGCTGGHTERLDLYPGSSKEVKGHTYFCGGKQYGDLDGDVVTAAKLFNALIPGLAGKIDATRKKN
jgi:hypothetical protein